MRGRSGARGGGSRNLSGHRHRAAVHARPTNDSDEYWLLVTDVDETLLGDRAGLRDFVMTVGPAKYLDVVLNSSRPIRSLHRTMRELRTDWRPLGMIGALGTEIELRGEPMDHWPERFEDFKRGPIDAVMARLGCRAHSDEFQTPLKASYEVPPSLRPEAQRLVRNTGVRSKIVLSGHSNFDVIAEGAGKAPALREVQTRLGSSPERTVAAGDSCNDLDMLSAKEARAIVVGNATPQLKAALRGTDAYFARASHAAGLLEGLQSMGAPLNFRDTTVALPIALRSTGPRASHESQAYSGEEDDPVAWSM